MIALVLVLIVAGLTAGSVGTGLLVRYRRRKARGTEWLRRSAAWWTRHRHGWSAGERRD